MFTLTSTSRKDDIFSFCLANPKAYLKTHSRTCCLNSRKADSDGREKGEEAVIN